MAIGFKEWALVCSAIGRGDQSLILRKGGIHEGRNGFRFDHAEFFLFPTLFHEQADRLKVPPGTPLPTREATGGGIAITEWVRVEWTELVTDREILAKLAPYHLWTDAVVEERFQYDEPPGVHVALLRAYRLSHPWLFPDESRYGGCRSWVTLPDPPADLDLVPVLDDDAHEALQAKVRKLVGKS